MKLLKQAVAAWPIAGADVLFEDAEGQRGALAAILGVPSHIMVGWLAFVVLGVFIFGLAFACLLIGDQVVLDQGVGIRPGMLATDDS